MLLLLQSLACGTLGRMSHSSGIWFSLQSSPNSHSSGIRCWCCSLGWLLRIYRTRRGQSWCCSHSLIRIRLVFRYRYSQGSCRRRYPVHRDSHCNCSLHIRREYNCRLHRCSVRNLRKSHSLPTPPQSMSHSSGIPLVLQSSQMSIIPFSFSSVLSPQPG